VWGGNFFLATSFFADDERAGPDRLNRIPRSLSGLLPGLVLCNFARGA
jgi:hypothetical protein